MQRSQDSNWRFAQGLQKLCLQPLHLVVHEAHTSSLQHLSRSVSTSYFSQLLQHGNEESSVCIFGFAVHA
jgi:hypothetical protein